MASQEKKHFCGCGCGGVIEIKIHHHVRGVPRFINHHATRVFNPGAAKSGELNPNWSGGRHVTPYGYVVVLNPDRTGKNDKYVREHRLVMARHLGRALLPSEDVHHRNGDKTDNRLENLELIPKDEHARLHDQELRARVGDERYFEIKRRWQRGRPYRDIIGERTPNGSS